MSMRLTPKLESQIEEILTTGNFPDAEAVVDAALKLLVEREQRLKDLDALLSAAERQVEEGRTVRYDEHYIDRLKREAAENASQMKPIDNDLIF